MIAPPIETPEPDIEKLQREYIEKHGHSGQVEYTSLQELNRVYEENNLPPVTLEELGVTQEEYEAAQTRIQSEDVASLRCDDPVYQWLGDINYSGSLTALDLSLANQVILGMEPWTTGAQHFGWISWHGLGTNPALTLQDVLIAQRVILGFPCL